MEQSQIIEGNLLIGKFMDNPHIGSYGLPNPFTNHIDDHQLKYHSSWEWLMPVLKKIESLDFHTAIMKTKPNRHLMHIYNFYDLRDAITTKGSSKRQVVYENIIKFIKWYNDKEKI